MNLTPRRRLFIASCLSLVATAMAFSIRADIIPALKTEFGFTDTQMGQIVGPGLWGFTITIALGGMLVDTLGMGRVMGFAFVGHLVGTLLTIFAQGYYSLYAATLLIGLANGAVEGAINPLTASLYPDQKTRALNRLHAWWPGGLIVGGLLSYAVTRGMGLDAGEWSAAHSLGWKIKTGLILLPALGYGALFLGCEFPKTERVASGITTREMFGEALRPLFLVFLTLMIFTTATELGPDQWIGNLLQNLVGIQGVLLLVYTAGIMFVLRTFFAGKLLSRLGPMGLLVFASALSSLGLYALGDAKTAWTVLGAATLFGLGKAFFWPTMVGVVSEQFPRGGALLMGLMGGIGMFSAGWLMTPAMGRIQDYYAVSHLSAAAQERVVTDSGIDERKVQALQDPAIHTEVEAAKKISAELTFKAVARIPAALIAIFLALSLWFRFSRGGYRAVVLAANVSRDT